jgi:Fur family ferric uptake transcriptional regulator
MQVTQEHLEKFKEALREEDLRLTSQRRAILEDMLASDEHRECDDIYFSLKEKGMSVSRATIYRTLELLEQVGFVRKLQIGDGRARYENRLSAAHHDHLICLRCGRIVEFVDRQIERRQQAISEEYGFELVRHSHHLFGLCDNCRDGDA